MATMADGYRDAFDLKWAFSVNKVFSVELALSAISLFNKIKRLTSEMRTPKQDKKILFKSNRNKWATKKNGNLHAAQINIFLAMTDEIWPKDYFTHYNELCNCLQFN